MSFVRRLTASLLIAGSMTFLWLSGVRAEGPPESGSAAEFLQIFRTILAREYRNPGKFYGYIRDDSVFTPFATSLEIFVDIPPRGRFSGPDFGASVAELTGQPFVSKREAMPTEYPSSLVYYNPAALDALARLVYIPADDENASIARTVYDGYVKNELRFFYQPLEFLVRLDEGRWLKQAAGDYLAAMRAEYREAPHMFHGGFYAYDHLSSHLLKMERDAGIHYPQLSPTIRQRMKYWSPEQIEAWQSFDRRPSLVGTIVRRQIDGTLPVILEWARRTVRDYDPEMYAKYHAKN